MKNKLLFILLFSSALTYSQVGIGTTSPTETLDIDGTLRVRDPTPTGINALKIGGLDANGVFHEITVGANLFLENNVLSARKTPFVHSFGSIVLEGVTEDYYGVDLKLGIGEANEGKSIIKISHPSRSSLKIFQIAGGYDGQQIWLLTARPSTINALTNIEIHVTTSNQAGLIRGTTMFIGNYEMVHMVYDASITTGGKWLIMSSTP